VSHPADERSELLELACRVAREAGTLAAEGRSRGVPATDSKTTVTDMVTEYDRATEVLIVERLRAARPDDGLIGEEGSDHIGSSGVRWVIDPIDGTTNFLYDLPLWAVSIGAVDDQGGLVGAVYVPPLGQLFAAARGRGATLDGRPLRCGTVTDPAVALVATGFAYLPERRAVQGARVARLLAQVRDLRRMGAASIDLCYVAAGRLDAYFEEGLHPWDYAAGELIATEAGCRTGDFHGGRPSSRGVLAANPTLFEPLRRIVVESMELRETS
jgi:myo-inositol-1(or 4)-monophosphatase